MKSNIFVLFTAITVSFFLSCKGKDDPQPTSSKTDIITQKTWVVKGAQEKVNGIWVDDHSSFTPTEMDDIYTFKRNGTLDRNEGPTKANASDPQIISTTWKFDDNETTITVDGDKSTLFELTDTKLVIGESDYRTILGRP